MVVILCLQVSEKEPVKVTIFITKWSPLVSLTLRTVAQDVLSFMDKWMNPQVLEPELVYLDSQLLSISEMKKVRKMFFSFFFFRKGRPSLYWQHFQIHLSLFRSVCTSWTYPICRRILTYLSYRSWCPLRKNHNNHQGIHYLSVSYLRTCRRSYWSCPSYYLRSLGCYYSAF